MNEGINLSFYAFKYYGKYSYKYKAVILGKSINCLKCVLLLHCLIIKWQILIPFRLV